MLTSMLFKTGFLKRARLCEGLVIRTGTRNRSDENRAGGGVIVISFERDSTPMAVSVIVAIFTGLSRMIRSLKELRFYKTQKLKRCEAKDNPKQIVRKSTIS